MVIVQLESVERAIEINKNGREQGFLDLRLLNKYHGIILYEERDIRSKAFYFFFLVLIVARCCVLWPAVYFIWAPRWKRRYIIFYFM